MLALLAACAQTEEGVAPPLASLQFPTGVALTPEGAAIPQRLLVVSSNFDLRFRSGVLHAFDREALDRLVDEAPPSPGCPPSNPRCLPAAIPELDGALVGAVEIGDYGGAVGVATLGEGRLRVFVPVRGSRAVIAAELDGAGIRCARGDAPCDGVRFPREDPYSVVVSLGNVYVGHFTVLTHTDPKGGVIGAAAADAPFWTQGGGSFQSIRVGNTAIGGLAAGGCRSDEGGEPVCTLFASGRSRSFDSQPIFAFDHREGELISSPLFRRNIYPQSKGFDSRGISVASSSEEIYLASHSPDALAVIDVTRLAQLPTDGCLIPEGGVVAPGAACPDLPPPAAEEPSFTTATLIPSPRGPNVVATLPRTSPAGEASDLVVLTTSDGLAFFDMRAGSFAGELSGLGGGPSDIAFRALEGGGFRLYVPSFSSGTLAVVDLPDPFRPESARVVARLGREQESDSL